MKKITASIFIIVTLLVFVSFTNVIFNGGNQMEQKEKVFQGPVPEGYNLEHFRKTGETIPLNKESGR